MCMLLCEICFVWCGCYCDGLLCCGIVVVFDVVAVCVMFVCDGIVVLLFDGCGLVCLFVVVVCDIMCFMCQFVSLLQVGLLFVLLFEMFVCICMCDGVLCIVVGFVCEIVGGWCFVDVFVCYLLQFGMLYCQLIEVGEVFGLFGIVLIWVVEYCECVDV